ncbi:EcKinase 9 [Halyomorpha halys]|nr:uncharacterized protein LOC106687290 [Halyomorpha halys]KAE8573328.1 EcKinase 9 [Halyomorpha halys]
MILPSEDVREVVRNYLKSDDFQIISCGAADNSDISGGYLSAQNKARIKFKTCQGEGELHVFIKVLPVSQYHRQTVLDLESFSREVILFNEVLYKYSDFLKDNTIPACYLARSNEIMVMEDIAKKGFRNRPLYETFDLEHCKKTLEALAKFHALSFITEKWVERKMSEIVPVIMTEMFATKRENYVGRNVVLASIRSIKRVVEEYVTHVPLEVVKKAFHYLDNVFDEMKSSEVYPNVLTHGDLWANNIMFRNDEQGNVAEACIFDFQLATYKPPGYDILLFLHCCTETDMRDKHLGHLMRLYYDVLAKTLRSAGIDVEDIISWQDFTNMLKDMLPLGLAQACIFSIFVLVPDFIIKDVMSSDKKYKEYFEVERTEYILEAMKKHKEFNRRIIQTVTNFLNYFTTDL